VNQLEYLAKWSALHGDAKLSKVVTGWLRLSYFIVQPLIKIGLSANAISVLGLFLGVFTYLQAKSPLAILWVALSLICDGLDGTVAILKGSASKFGAVLDSVLDRATEFFWLLALYQIGLPNIMLLSFFLISSLQEYLRARAGGVGYTSVAIVTWAERPVRAIFVFMILIAFQIGFTNLTLILWVMMAMQISAFTKLFLVMRKSL
jgi:phosphatidylglycerophosphate synthase